MLENVVLMSVARVLALCIHSQSHLVFLLVCQFVINHLWTRPTQRFVRFTLTNLEVVHNVTFVPKRDNGRPSTSYYYLLTHSGWQSLHGGCS